MLYLDYPSFPLIQLSPIKNAIFPGILQVLRQRIRTTPLNMKSSDITEKLGIDQDAARLILSAVRQ